jgi:hypothetical protein
VQMSADHLTTQVFFRETSRAREHKKGSDIVRICRAQRVKVT